MRRGIVNWRCLLAVPLHRESMNVYREIFLYWTRVVSRTKAPETEDRVIYCNKKLNTVVYGLVEWVNVDLCECVICIYNFSIYFFFFLFIHWRGRNAETCMLVVIFLLYFALLLVIFLLFCIDYSIVLLYLYWFKKHYLYWFWFLLWINFFE